MSRAAGHTRRADRVLLGILGLVAGCTLLAIFWQLANRSRHTLTELPHYVAVGPARLSIKIVNANAAAKSRELWLVEFMEGENDRRLVATLTDPWSIYHCSIADTLCAIESHIDSGEYTIHRWQVLQSELTHFTETGLLTDTEASIFAMTSRGIVFGKTSLGGTVESIYSKNDGDGTITTIADRIDHGCLRGPFLSPHEEYLAVMCWPNAWLKPFNRAAPTGQQIHLFRTDGSLHRTLIDQSAYDLRSGLVSGIPEPFPGGFEWAPDGTEIAFVAAFSPPQLLSSANTTGAIHTISITDDVLHEWVKLGELAGRYDWEDQQNADPHLAWSPDNAFIAYTLSGNDVYIASRDGKSSKIGDFDFPIEVLSWSFDGRHIAVAGKNQLWALSTVDDIWHKIDLSGEIIDMLWLTPQLP